MVLPILCYDSEIWGFHKATDIERVHVKFIKQVLCVKQNTTTLALYGELGRFPLYIARKLRLFNYWLKIVKQPHSLLYKLMNMKDNNGNFILQWTKNVKSMFDSVGLSNLFSIDINTEQLNFIKQRVYDQYIQCWFYSVDNSRKLDTYCYFKTCFEFETYLMKIDNPLHCSALTKLRCSSHSLAIEDGRYRNVDRENKKCIFCNMNVIENEFHFVLVCSFYRDLRNKILPRYYCTWPTITKFQSLMQTKQSGVLNKLAKFVYHDFAKRKLNMT